MSGSSVDRTDLRSAALDGHLERREVDGYRVETRSSRQAVIVRRRPLSFLFRIARPSAADQRLVVSVDEAGEVTEVAAEPRRW